ncbi:hypothetical protein TPE_1409 [Treponema pedis str. T A4]|uniref:Uncharacterized protein n=1 Tax=Treponema pedis str. T A4 TaxID=1291379 RepID=S6A8I8_9SPIR|nr:hypothetical protein TPE_1409 [Treponema pedis str. T A4]
MLIKIIVFKFFIKLSITREYKNMQLCGQKYPVYKKGGYA